MSNEVSEREFQELLLACREIASAFPEGVVYIGGIAVYLHAVNDDRARPFAEFTHDADFYISLADMADLRDLEELTPNRRLNKHQLTKRGFEFDIYTERHSALIVPYSEVIARAVVYEVIKVAALEHLLVLKLEAYRERWRSSKGEKDAKDLLRIGLIAANMGKAFDPAVCLGFMGDEHLELLDKVRRGPEALSLSGGNAKVAKSLREQFGSMVDSIARKAGKRSGQR